MIAQVLDKRYLLNHGRPRDQWIWVLDVDLDSEKHEEIFNLLLETKLI
jgi:hypothetical protein